MQLIFEQIHAGGDRNFGYLLAGALDKRFGRVRRVDQHAPPGVPIAVGGGVQEARVMFGAGYRIYFGQDGASLVLLLVGGTKATQAKDVRRAQEFWRDYLEEK